MSPRSPLCAAAWCLVVVLLLPLLLTLLLLALVDSVVSIPSCPQVAILLGGFPRRPGMERGDLIGKNAGIMKVRGVRECFRK